jgi:ABC-type dipeptide/oligopeptide/nickel transport system ATPase subunit
MNPSVLLPKFHYRGREIRSNISILILGTSGSGKTTFLEIFKKLIYYPLEFEYITPAKIAKELSETNVVTMVVNDMARIMGNKDTIKTMENIIEEGKFIHTTMTSEYNINVNSNLIGVAVPADITKYMGTGFLFRVIPIMLKHDLEAQQEIGKDITNNIGKNKSNGVTIEDIKEHYEKLRLVQAGKIKGEHPITGFDIHEDYRNIIYEEWAEVLEKLDIDEKTLWFRELLDGFRFLNSLAFLNYFNRGNENGILVPNESDVKIAKKLMLNEIFVKYDITQLYEVAKQLEKGKKIRA